MRLLPFILVIFVCLNSCKSSKIASNRNAVSTSKEPKAPTTNTLLADDIVSYAQTFNGTKYKFGGTTNKGMDCSGLVHVAFKKENIILPRISRDMAKEGKSIAKENVQKGDLLFFKTSKNRKTINHVGLVVSSKRGLITFIHSTTSKGVITSTLSNPYWKASFIEARQVL